MKKKITAAIKSRTGKIVAKFKKTPTVVYSANSKSHIPHTISMPGMSFYDKFEHHLQNNHVVIPQIDGKLTWELLTKHNPKLRRVRVELLLIEKRNYPDKAWDNVANRLLKVLKKYHEPMEQIPIKKKRKLVPAE
jgi:hypothetical protein